MKMELHDQIAGILSELRFIEEQTTIQTDQYLEQMKRLGSRRSFLLGKMDELNAIRPRQPTQKRAAFRFNDHDLSVSWDGGRMQFRSSGIKAYQLIKIVIGAGSEGIEIADLAEMLFDDQLASIKKTLYSARINCQNSGFPGEINNDDGKIIIQ